MHPTHISNNSETGSRWHFLLAVAIAVIISIGLTSTAAKAGLLPATPSTAQFEDTPDDTSSVTAASMDMPHTAGAYQPAVVATPALLVNSGGASDLAVRPFLEEEEEFAPKFQHVVARGRPGQRNVLSQLGCALFASRSCVHSTRT